MIQEIDRDLPEELTGELPRQVDVCLVSMPYASLPRPSLALGLLKAVLEREGIPSTVLYPNLWFAEEVGLALYHLCSHWSPTEFLAGEWTFAEAAFPGTLLRDEEYLRRLGEAHRQVVNYNRSPKDAQRLVRDLRTLRAAATGFIERTARRVLSTGARIVGCTSTFEQHAASLALLRRIREIAPAVVTMMGGANCETAMGQATHRSFPWVDFVVSGDGDGLLPDLCRSILEEGRDIAPDRLPAGVLGPASREQRPVRLRTLNSGAPLARANSGDLDALPIPDFEDYFDTLRASSLSVAIRPGLPLETSRGCWWGAARHCTFCGLNGSGMAFRSKSPERVLAEIRTMEEHYGISDFETVDNILDMSYFRTVLPRLAEDGKRRRLFYEVKANLKRWQIEMLLRAGVTWVQPGVESLHTEVLSLMDKGVQGWQNLQLLRWSRELGLRLSWSVLWGFPGEEDRWYHDMAAWLPWIEHLQPPAAVIRVRFDRYSVFHERAEELGLELRPIPAMSYVYPLPLQDLQDLTYFFVAEGAPHAFLGHHSSAQDRPGVAEVRRRVSAWRRAFWSELPPVLAMDDDGEVLRLLDSRSCALEPRPRLTGLSRTIYLACEEAPLEERLPETLADSYRVAASRQEVTAAVEDLKRRRLMLAMDRRLIALAVRGSLPHLPDQKQFPGGTIDESRMPPPRRPLPAHHADPAPVGHLS